MKGKLIFLKILLVSQFILGQNISIIADLENVKDSTRVLFSKSFDDNASHFINNSDFVIINNCLFQKSFTQNSIGIVQINFNPNLHLRVLLFCENGDKIKLNIKNNNGIGIVQFEGSNAEGLNYINNSSDFNKLFLPIGEVFNKSETSSEINEKLELLKSNNLSQLKLLLNENKITKSFYDFSIIYLETEIMGLSYLYLENFLKFDKNSPFTTKLNEVEIKKTIQTLDEKYNVFDEKYKSIKTITQYHNVINKCIFIEKKVLKSKMNNLGLWDNLDFKKYSFAPKELQEFLIYNEIIKNDFDVNLFNNYKTKLPNGVYITPLENQYSKIKPFNVNSNTLLAFNPEDKNLKTISFKENKSIIDLIKNNFSGKSVFVDIWATWCGPCKSEFRYSNELISFLKSKDIEILYVTIDKETAKKRWETFILENELFGNHCFSSINFFENLKLTLSEPNLLIPRYLLFNANGELVLKNAKRPSEGQKLYDEILNALK